MKRLKFDLIFFLLISFISILNAQPTTFSATGIGGGGALFFPKINPGNDNEFYVSCDMSELFHSTDFGKSYSQIHHSQLQVFNTSTFEFTNDNNIAYCTFNDGNAGYPVKTSNAGVSWQKMTGYNQGTYGQIYKMSANYNNPKQLLIGAYGDIIFSNDGGGSFTLVKHTNNMGAGIIMGGVLWDGNNIYIGTNEGLIISNNGGSTFTLNANTGIPSSEMIWSFAGGKTGSTTRFICITAATGNVYNGVMPWDYYNFAKGVYSMDNVSGTWKSSSSGLNFSNDFIMYAAMAENDISQIYLGGHDNALSAPLVYKSADGGSSWSKCFKTTNNSNIATGWEGASGDKNWSWSETCFGISVAPKNANKVIFSNFSNVQTSIDGGSNWKQAYVSSSNEHPSGSPTPTKKSYASIGLENTTCWQVHWFTPSKLMGCFSDIGGIRSIDGGKTWGFNYSGFSANSLYRVTKSSNGTTYGGCSNIHDIYQSTRLTDALLDANDANGKIIYSSDSGQTWTTIHTFNHPVYWLEADPKNQDVMYASVIHFGGTQNSQLGGIYATVNLTAGAASTWAKLSNPPRTEGHPAVIHCLKDGKMVCTFSGRRTAAGTFTNSSGVFLFDPKTGKWSDVTSSATSPPHWGEFWIKDLAIDPNDPNENTWYVSVFSGWGKAPDGAGGFVNLGSEGGLYRTTDRGSTWTKITGNQFSRVASVSFNPKNTKQTYLATETQGLWFSSDITLATPIWKLIDAYSFRQPERIYFNPYNQDEVWISSFGNGMKLGTVKVSKTTHINKNEIIAFPNPSQKQITIQGLNPENEPIELQLFDLQGNNVNVQYQFNPLSFNTEQLSQGNYFIVIKCKNQTSKTIPIVISN